MKLIQSINLGVAFAILTLLAGCGGSSKPHAHPAAEAEGAVKVVRITGNDAMQFSHSEIRAKPGQAIALILTNTGKMPKQGMAHNWVLLKAVTESEVNKIGMAAATKAPDYMPDDRSNIIVYTKMLGPGESDTIEFDAPSEPGKYPFICTFPGHYAIMRGNLIVQ
jgi:azurin